MKIINKNLVPDQLGNYLVTLSTFGPIARCTNLDEWMEGINESSATIFGGADGMLTHRILKVGVAHGHEVGATLVAVIQPYGVYSNILTNGLDGSGLAFKPVFRNNDPTNVLIKYDIDI